MQLAKAQNTRIQPFFSNISGLRIFLHNPDKPIKCILCYKKAVVSRHHISQCTLNTTA